MSKKLGIVIFLLMLSGAVFSTTDDLETDTTPPTLEFLNLEYGQELKGIVNIEIDARDGGWTVAPESVKLYLESKLLQTIDGKSFAEKVGDEKFTYIFEWDTTEHIDGEYILKVKAKDRSFKGNMGEKKITIKIMNRYDYEGQFEELEERQKEITELIEKFEGYDLDCSTIESEKNEMDSLIIQAENAFEKEDLFIAKEEAIKNLYYKIKQELLLSGTTKTCIIGEEGEKITITDIGLTDVLVNRKIEFKKAKIGDIEKNVADFILTVKNNSSETKTIQLVEKIPKEFAESASEISSNLEFEVIEEDPIIMWNLEISAGQTKEISYILKNEIPEEVMEKAEEIFNNKPAVLDSGIEVTSALFSENIETLVITDTERHNQTTGLFALGDYSNIINILAVLVGLGLIAFAVSKVNITVSIGDKNSGNGGKFSYKGKL